MSLDAPPVERPQPARMLARALLLGERIDTAGLERRDAISTVPLALRVDAGVAVVFRYGVVVMIGLDALKEDEVLRAILPRVQGPLSQREEEVIEITAADEREEGIALNGVVSVGAPTPEKLLVVADALAKSAAV